MPEAPEEMVGPLNQVEIMLLHGEGNRHDKDIKDLETTVVNLEKSLDLKRRELSQFKARKDKILREVVKCRGKDPQLLPIRELARPTDNTTWIILGGKPQ